MRSELSPVIQRFLKKVKRKLNMPGKLKNRVISDLTTSIAAQLEDGASEEAVLHDLGTPAKAAAELNEQMKEYTYHKSPWRFLFLAAAILSSLGILIVSYLSLLLNGMFTQSQSVGVIGGADGPTAIFLATAPKSAGEVLLPYIVVLVIAVIGYVCFSRRKNKKQR